MNPMDDYRRAQDGFDAVLAAVPATSWDTPSMCARWSVRDVAGHVIWGQHLVRHWATGEEYTSSAGAPGAGQPGDVAGADPLTAWRTARAASVAELTPEALAVASPNGALDGAPLAVMVTILTTDHLVHAWDIGHAIGLEMVLDPALVEATHERVRGSAPREPGFFGPELAPPADADAQLRLLAYLGRAPRDTRMSTVPDMS